MNSKLQVQNIYSVLLKGKKREMRQTETDPGKCSILYSERPTISVNFVLCV